MKLTRLLFLAGLLGAACATTAPPSEAPSAAAPPGKLLYERSCARCHALYAPSSFAAPEWRFYVRKYGRRARLDKAQRGVVYNYLAAHARK